MKAIDTYKQVPYPNQRLSKNDRLLLDAIGESKDISIKVLLKDGTYMVYRPRETTKKFAHDIRLAVQGNMMEILKGMNIRNEG